MKPDNKERREFLWKTPLAVLGLALGLNRCEKQNHPLTATNIDPQEGYTPLKRKTLEAITGINLTQPIYHIALDIEKQYFKVDESCYLLLDWALENIDQNLQGLQEPIEILEEINWTLEENLGYITWNQCVFRGPRFSEGIKIVEDGRCKGKITKDCKIGSLLYLSVADNHDWPLTLVEEPSHVFLRWNGEKSFDWETLDGKVKPQANESDATLQREYQNIEQYISMIYMNLSYALVDNYRPEDALDSAKKSVITDPKSSNAHHAHGYVLYKLKKYDEAIEACDKALEIQPSTKTITLKEICFNQMKDRVVEKAMTYFPK